MIQPNAETEPEQAEDNCQAEALGDVIADWVLAGQAIGDWPGIR